MARDPLLHSSLGERTGLSAADLLREEQPSLDPLAPLVQEGVTPSRLRSVAARVLEGPRVDLVGVRGSAGAALVAEVARRTRRTVLCLSADLESARRFAVDAAFYLATGASEDGEPQGSVLLYPASESSPFADVNPDRPSAMARMATLFHLAKDLPLRVLCAPAAALVRKVVPRSAVLAHGFHVVAEEELDRDALIRGLSEAGYLRVPVVEDPGSFAVRGALIDLWPPSSEAPHRVELYDELVVSIKPFDPFEQRTRPDEGLRDLWVPPAKEAILTAANLSLARRRISELADALDMPTTRARALADDVTSGRAFFGADGFLPAYYDALSPLGSYLPDDAIVVLEDPPEITLAIREELERITREAEAKAGSPHFPPDRFLVPEDEIGRSLAARSVLTLSRTALAGGEVSGLGVYEIARSPLDLASGDHEDLGRAVKQARGSRGKTATLDPLVRRIAHYRDHGLRVFLAARAATQAERLQTLLGHLGITCRVRLGAFDPRWLEEPPGSHASADIVVGSLSRGVVLPADGVVVVTEEEIFGGRAHRRREKKAADTTRPFLEDLRSLSVGDLVVHVEHGIGRYHGLVHKSVGGLVVDLLVVEYAGADKLYLPVYRLNQIQKFSGGENAAPRLDRLGGSTFAKTKSRVRREVRKMADELLRLYAERQAHEGISLPASDDEYRAFEATFAFEETPDQARAIEDVNSDLELPRPMDRLVCGDVGFGKTEVAIRAAFRVAMAGRQVCLLCPTTILAQQHFRTFEARLQSYPVAVRGLSRFQSKKEHDETLRLVKEGKVDILIGTHRLLSRDVHFKDLGLLVVDEEQRFGVAHKERIKQLKTQVDVLTLSATPIPRTLQMAVGGLRDLSLITTPPLDRRSVRTVVTRFDEQVIREAIGRELQRGGQVFYVYNRIDGLYERAQRLQAMVPNARIAVAHGQMSKTSSRGGEAESNLERTMLDFVEGRYDVLCATAIVESGLDIPRANTIIIDRADLFGLAQLYQLRGRVGRSKERAYCYLVVPPQEAMTDEARARVDALERHTDLGSGFKIASLDLELRGSGDLLGGEQSGSVSSVGFDLFCQMLEEAVHELRGEVVVHEVDTEMSFDVEALIPEDYVSEVGVRLSLYKRLAGAVDEAHVSDIAVEMEDRFGPPPEPARRLVQLMSLKTELRRLKVLGCEATSRSVTLHLREDTPLDPRKITELVRDKRSPYRLSPDMRLTRRFDGESHSLANVETTLSELSHAIRP